MLRGLPIQHIVILLRGFISVAWGATARLVRLRSLTRPPAVVLGPADVFHLRAHQEMRAQGLSGNNCAVLAELDAPVDPPRLLRRLQRAMELLVEMRWQLSTDRWLRPVWCDAAPSVRGRLHVVGAGSQRFLDIACERLERPLSGNRPWELDLLRGEGNDALLLRWYHPLTDARGAARWLAWLGSPVADRELTAPAPAQRTICAGRLLPGDRRARLDLARGYFRHVMRLAQRPIMSLQSAQGNPRPAPMRSRRLLFSVEQTRAFDRSVRRRARLADTSILLFAAVRLLDSALRARGFSPPRFLAPVPISLDGKHQAQRMFSNHLSMMMLCLDRELLDDEAGAVASLAVQRRAIVREQLDVGMLAGLDLASVLPSRLYSYSARRPFAGERSSLLLSNPGRISMSQFLDRQVVDAYALAAAMVPPGFQVISSRHAGRLGVVVGYADGLFRPGELDRLMASFERDLLG